MTYRIQYTPQAVKDLDAVWDDVLEVSQSIETADRYINDFMDTIAEKRSYPKTGSPLYYRGLFTGFYSISFKAYKAFYRIEYECIQILRILLSKSDYLKVLFGESE